MKIKVKTVLEQAIEDLTRISNEEDEEFELNLQINDDIKIVLNEIERLNNIIEEVKEKIKTKYIIQGGLTSYEVNDLLNELLEILDKDSDK